MSATTLINVVPKLQGNNGNAITSSSNDHTLQSAQSTENGTVLVSNLPAPSFFEQNKTLVIIIGIVIILCVVLMIFVAVYGTEAIFKREKPQNAKNNLAQRKPPPLNTQMCVSSPEAKQQQQQPHQQPLTKSVDVSEEMKYVNMKKQVSFADKKEEHTNVPSTKNTNNNDEDVNSNNSSDESPAHSTSHTTAPAPANNFYTSDDMFDISALEPPAKPHVHQPREQKDVLTQIPLYVRNSDDKDMPDIWRSKEEVSVAALVESYKTYKNPVIEKFMSTSRMSKFLNKSSV